MSRMTTKKHLKIREDAAKDIEKKLERIINTLQEYVPQYEGKTRLIDRVLKAKAGARLLAINLKSDQDYWEQK